MPFLRSFTGICIAMERRQDTGCRIQDAGYRMQDAGCRMQDAGYRMQLMVF
jgi:hypothetical protein